MRRIPSLRPDRRFWFWLDLRELVEYWLVERLKLHWLLGSLQVALFGVVAAKVGVWVYYADQSDLRGTAAAAIFATIAGIFVAFVVTVPLDFMWIFAMGRHRNPILPTIYTGAIIGAIVAAAFFMLLLPYVLLSGLGRGSGGSRSRSRASSSSRTSLNTSLREMMTRGTFRWW